MPGVIMDDSGSNGSEDRGGQETRNGILPALEQADYKSEHTMHATPITDTHVSNGPILSNGAESGSGASYGNRVNADRDRSGSDVAVNGPGRWPPELPRVAADGFFPLATMISRTSQKCLVDLNDLVRQLKEINVQPQNPALNSNTNYSHVNGAAAGNQTYENLQKKTQILEFAQEKRQQFIKLMVISSWSRQAADVRKTIDIKVWIDNQLHDSAWAVDSMGHMKRRLATEKNPPPDLDTAVEVLSMGKVSRLPDLGLLPRKPLTAKKTLKILKRINVLLSIKINLIDKVDFPDPFLDYRIQDGRVTFTVPTEFELDLSIADEDIASQFYFVDLRFLFTPSSPIPDGRLRQTIEYKANEVLRTGGLMNCFNHLHDLVLTTKTTHFRNLAAVMARGLWTESLRIDYLHRTLVVQYWIGRPGPKSWVEIGIVRGRRKQPKRSAKVPGIPFIDIRWLREKNEIADAKIKFDIKDLNLDVTMRSVTAIHISHILKAMYDKVMESGMYKNGKMAIKLSRSRRNPHDCALAFQLTKNKALKVIIEPVSGRVVLCPPSPQHSRFEYHLNASRDLAKDGGVILAQLRCSAVKEEVEYRARTMGWEVLQSLRLTDADKKRFFPKDMIAFCFLRQKSWRDGWHLLSTHGLSSDLWWVVQVKSRLPPTNGIPLVQANLGFGIQSAETIDIKYVDSPSANLSFSHFKRLSHVASGMISLHANSLGLVKLKVTHDLQSLENALPSELPYILVQLDPRKLPSLFPKAKGAPNEAWCDESIRFSFQGLHPLTSAAKLLAQGHLTRSFNPLVKLNSNSDTSVSYDPKTHGFAFHFTVAPGISVGVVLLQRLQRLERLVSSLGVFRRFKLTADHVSLSNVVFSYASNLRAHVDFDYIELRASLALSERTPAKGAKPKMNLQFSKGNPHLCLREHLNTILNGSGGLEEVAFILKASLPALRGLADIEQSHYDEQQSQTAHNSTSNTSQIPPSKPTPESLILYRSADWYGICYLLPPPINGPNSESNHTTLRSRMLCKLDLRLKDRRDTTNWLLTSSINRPVPPQVMLNGLAARLKEEVFSIHGPGWKGLGTGAVCEDEEKRKVGEIGAGSEEEVVEDRGVRNLLRTVDAVVRRWVNETEPVREAPDDGGEGKGINSAGQEPKSDDVIMID